MVAVNDRECADAPADPSVSAARFGGFSTPAVDVEQRGDDLKVVLYAMMDFANEPSLPLERVGSLLLGLLDPVDRAAEGVSKFLDLGTWAELAWKIEGSFTRAVR
jgi:hypothetical protein